MKVKRKLSILLVLMGVFIFLANSAHAFITVTPYDASVPISPAFGSVVAGGLVTDQYKGYGVIFSDGVPTAIFNDPPYAFGGVNANGIVDLLAPVNGHFVTPGTTDIASTNYLSVEAGLAGEGNLLLQVYDINMNLLGSTYNDDGYGPNSRTLLTIATPGIVYFSVSTPASDEFGVDQLSFSTPSSVPLPAAFWLLGSGLVGLVGMRKRIASKLG